MLVWPVGLESWTHEKLEIEFRVRTSSRYLTTSNRQEQTIHPNISLPSPHLRDRTTSIISNHADSGSKFKQLTITPHLVKK